MGKLNSYRNPENSSYLTVNECTVHIYFRWASYRVLQYSFLLYVEQVLHVINDQLQSTPPNARSLMKKPIGHDFERRSNSLSESNVEEK